MLKVGVRPPSVQRKPVRTYLLDFVGYVTPAYSQGITTDSVLPRTCESGKPQKANRAALENFGNCGHSLCSLPRLGDLVDYILRSWVSRPRTQRDRADNLE